MLRRRVRGKQTVRGDEKPGKRPAAATPAKSRSVRRRPAVNSRPGSKTHVRKVVKSMVPKSRTSYAIFVEEQYPLVKAALFPDLGQGKCTQQGCRQVVAHIAKAWNQLGEDEASYYKEQAQLECRERQEAMQGIIGGNNAAQDQVCREGQEHVQVGPFEYISGAEVLTRGTCASVYLVRHSSLRSQARSVVYSSQQNYRYELQGLKLLRESLDLEADVHLDDLYVRVLHFSDTGPCPTIVQEMLEPLEASRFVKPEFKDVVVQMCRSLAHLHAHCILHLDVRPKSWLFNPMSKIAKLSNFHAAMRVESINEPTRLDYHPYAQAHRAPELHCPIAAVQVSWRTESWSLGTTVAEIASGVGVFSSVGEMLNFEARGPENVKSNRALQCLSPGVRMALLSLVAREAERLSVSQFVQQKDLLNHFEDVGSNHPGVAD
ncbi:GSK1 [Symbiodinium natans]|uniref:GSK1 protein n=1 Tax=Symbiodinium natans TaxID=878477 RepID=A0A812PTT3_9DINO|nr:GSK1 [Symbiodinium natans]